ncbi:MAG: DinB family protein [Flavobacteriales bacterium]|nr:DinB family protein [Flavobacteriales bacterium]
MNTRDLIDALQNELRRQLEHCALLREMPLERLHLRPAPKRWSAMEVLRHMVISSGHYHARLERLYADENNGLRFRTNYLPGRWGDFSVKAMEPKPDGRIGWRMKTMGMFEPRHVATTGWLALDDFEALCRGSIGLLERARTRGLEGEKVTSTLGPVLQFKAGDAFRFPVAHQRRHWLQLERTLHEVGAGSLHTLPTHEDRVDPGFP